MTELNATSPTAVVEPREIGVLGLFREWLLRDRAIASGPALTATQRERRARARTASQLAETALGAEGPHGALSDEASPDLALSLYREAAFWALWARSSEATPRDLAEAFELAPEPYRDDAALRAALVTRGFVETAALDREEQHRDAIAASGFVRSLLDGLDAREQATNERWTRVASLCVFVAFVTVGLPAFWRATRPGLADTRPWTASSATWGFAREGRGVRAQATAPKVFFHTQLEPSPWISFDLQDRATVRSVTVHNRGDCCQERAAPLVVELSDDGATWSAVARRDETFADWTATFAPRTTRFVRLRATQTTFLHLAGVEIR